MDILLEFIVGNLVGDPIGPIVPTDILKFCTTDIIDYNHMNECQ